jgi:hypothetical protein
MASVLLITHRLMSCGVADPLENGAASILMSEARP